MKKLILFLFLISFTAFAQEYKGVIVKSNLINLLAKRPAISVEKALSSSFSLEASYVTGETTAMPFADEYSYNGFLLRGKKYLSVLQKNKSNLYYGAYFGNLNRTIKKEGYVHPTGFFLSSPDRNFSSRSVRTGGSLGILFIPIPNIIIDGSASLGYGRYFDTKNKSLQLAPRGYMDAQIWFSVGYSIK